MVTGSTAPRAKETRIYIFDRDDDVRDSLKMLLESNDIIVNAFAKPSEFLTEAATHPSDCLVLGFNRLIVEGLDLLAVLRSRRIETPVIFIGGGGDPSARAASLRAGADTFLERPFEEATLLRAVIDVLPRRQARKFMQSKQGR
jgi:two-component system response regulator FixJ